MPSDLTLPASEQVAPGSTTDVSGISFNDSFAAGNPGDLYLSITDAAGELTATDSAGTVSGSGTNSIMLNATYADVQAILGSLAYIAPNTDASDTIGFDIWDQAGVESTGTIPVAVSSGGTTETWTGAVSTDWNTGGNWSGGIVPTAGDTVIIPGVPNAATLSDATLTGETITLTNGNDLQQAQFIGVTLNSLLQDQGTTTVGIFNTLTVGSVGTIAPGANNQLTLIGNAESIVNDGSISSAGGTLELIVGPPTSRTLGTLINHTVIEANGGTLDIRSVAGVPGGLPDWNVINSGTIEITNGGDLGVNGTIQGGQIIFNGAGTLALQQPQALTGGATVIGFEPGDAFALIGPAFGTITGFVGNRLEVGASGSIESFAIDGGYGLGNFVEEINGSAALIAYAPGGAGSGITDPDIIAPGFTSVAQSATLALNDVTIAATSDATVSLTIDAGSGTLAMNGASGSGTGQVTTGPISVAEANADLASLSYVAATGAKSDTVSIEVASGGTIETLRWIPITVTAATGGGNETWTGVVSSDWNTAGNWSGGAVPVSGDTVIIPPGTPNNATLSDAVLTGETIFVQSSSTADPVVDFNNVTLGAGTDLSATGVQFGLPGSVMVGGTLTVAAGAVIDPINPSGLTLNPATSGATVVNDGSVTNGGPGGFLWFGLNLVNNGVVAATSPGRSVDIEGLLTNNGTVLVNNGVINLDGGVSGGVVTFAGPGEVTAGQPMTFANGASVSGFGQGDLIHMFGGDVGGSLSFTNGTLDISSATGTLLQAIPMTGGLGLGNFLLQTQLAAKAATGTAVLYAPDGGFANQGTGSMDISAPATAIVAQGGTLALNDVSIANATTLTLDIFASSGTLSMNGASGSGTNHLTITSLTSESQINSDLASLTYTPAAGASDATIKVTVDTPIAGGGTTEAARYIPITVNGSDTGPALTEPSSESVTPNSTTSVSGSYADSFAQGNSGDLFLGISDSSGLLNAKDAAGNAVAGSGTNQIVLNTDYADLNAVLGSLTYTASANTGSDTVNFDIWNQAGVETTGTVAVAISGGTSGPTLTEPASETVSTNGTTAVAGSYTDSFAQGNSGQLFLSISDSGGTLTAQDASGQAVAGSGTSSIALNTDYVDLNAILASLHYTSGGSAGSDNIQFRVWNQAGMETNSATAITIGAAATAATMSPEDLAPPAPVPAAPTDPVPAAGSTTVAMLNDINGAPIGTPLNPNH